MTTPQIRRCQCQVPQKLTRPSGDVVCERCGGFVSAPEKPRPVKP